MGQSANSPNGPQPRRARRRVRRQLRSKEPPRRQADKMTSAPLRTLLQRDNVVDVFRPAAADVFAAADPFARFLDALAASYGRKPMSQRLTSRAEICSP